MIEPTPQSTYDIISLHNIDDEDFTFEYDRSKGNLPYTIPAGDVRRFPRFLANHALKHLIDKIMIKRKIRVSNITVRQELADQIVVDEEVYQRAAQKTEAERLQEDVEAMNIPSELDAVLARKKEQGKKEEEVETAKVVEEEKEEEKFEGLEEVKDEEPKETPLPTPPPAEEVKPIPTRTEIYEYAKKTLNMVLDDKTKAKFDKMKVPELLKELGDPREVIP